MSKMSWFLGTGALNSLHSPCPPRQVGNQRGWVTFHILFEKITEVGWPNGTLDPEMCLENLSGVQNVGWGDGRPAVRA